MKIAAAVLCFAATPAVAQFDCVLRDPDCTTECTDTSVRFTIDTSQFAPPQDPNDPPRRQVTTVTMNDAIFVAEAIMMSGGVRGFHEDAGQIGSRLMIVQPDGRARLVLKPINQTLIGLCTTN